MRREVFALVDAGYEVDVVCTRRRGEPFVAHERDGRLTVYRLPIWHRRGGVVGYAAEYLAFFLMAAAVAAALHLRRRYRLVQVHTLPDSLVFATLVPRALGAKVLLDLHECMPEFFATKFGAPPGHPVVRVLGAVEQAAIRYAHHAITCTEQMREAFIRRGADPGRIDVVLNSSDETVFRPDAAPSPAANGRFTLVCHGALEPRYGVDTIVRAVALLAPDLPDLALEIYGDGTERPGLRRLADDLGVADRVRFSDGYVPVDELVAAIARADAGVVAVKPDPFRDLTQCNKMYDFVAMRRPALVSRTASVVASFAEDCFGWFEGGDHEDLARAVRRLHGDHDWARRLVERATAQAEPYRWPRQRTLYLETVRRTIGAA